MKRIGVGITLILLGVLFYIMGMVVEYSMQSTRAIRSGAVPQTQPVGGTPVPSAKDSPLPDQADD